MGIDSRAQDLQNTKLRVDAYNVIADMAKMTGAGIHMQSLTGSSNVYKDTVATNSNDPMPDGAMAKELNIDPKKFILIKPATSTGYYQSRQEGLETLQTMLSQHGISSIITNSDDEKYSTSSKNAELLIDTTQEGFRNNIQSMAVTLADMGRKLVDRNSGIARELQNER